MTREKKSYPRHIKMQKRRKINDIANITQMEDKEKEKKLKR